MQIKSLNQLKFCAKTYPLVSKKEEKVLFSKFKTQDLFVSLEKDNKKKSSKTLKIAFCSALALGIGAFFSIKRKKTLKISNLLNTYFC